MANERITSVIDNAFHSQYDLRKRIHEALKNHPDLSSLFSDISSLVADLQKAQLQPQPQSQSQTQLQPQKKRKHGDNNNDTNTSNQPNNNNAQDTSGANDLLQSGKPYFSAGEISFSIPQRKKFRLEFVRDAGIRAVAGAGESGGAYAFGVRWGDIEQIFCLPVPEKATRQRNYVVIPRGGDGVSTFVDNTTTNALEPLVWTVPETAPKTVTTGAGFGSGANSDVNAVADDETYVTVTSRAIKEGWGRRREVVVPRKEEFMSALTESHRKGEPAWHVKAFRGSKEGYLFFLPPGILWAFKKPILFFPLTAISSVSYTSILQRTFNLVITVTSVNSNNAQTHTSSSSSSSNNLTGPNKTNISANGNGTASTATATLSTTETEFEFSMLDQADYTGIDGYIKRHALNDASMAELRRAKLLNINGPPGGGSERAGGVDGVDVSMNDDGPAGAGGGGGGGDAAAMDDETELERAQRMIEDAEDEEEEDYEPEGSDESESEDESGSELGSGSDREVEEEDDDEEEEEEEDEDEDEREKEERKERANG